MIDHDVIVWDGRGLDDSIPTGVALFLCGTGPRGADSGRLMFGAASNGKSSCVLLREQLSLFLRHHSTADLVCFDAAETHRLLLGLFQEMDDGESASTLWDFSKQCRLIDVAFLDHHVRRCRGDEVGPEPESLSRLADRWGTRPIPGRDTLRRTVGDSVPSRPHDLDPGRLKSAIDVATSLSEIYVALCSAQAEILAELRFPDDVRQKHNVAHVNAKADLAILSPRQCGTTINVDMNIWSGNEFFLPSSFGPLGTSLEVAGAIAIDNAPRHGLLVDRDQFSDLVSRSESAYREASSSLWSHRLARKHLEWDNQEVVRDNAGTPVGIRDLLEAIAHSQDEGFCDIRGSLARMPQRMPSHPMAAVASLGVWARCDPTLRAVSRLVRAADVVRFADQCAGPVGHPVYSLQPFLCSSRPSLEFVRELGVPLFRPRSGHVFLVLQLSDLPLRCFIAHSRYLFPRAEESRLASLCRSGVSEALSQALALGRDEEEHRRLRAILEVLPFGLSTNLLRELLAAEYGLELTEVELEQAIEQLMPLLAGAEMCYFLVDGFDDPGSAGFDLADRRVRLGLGLSGTVSPQGSSRHEDLKVAAQEKAAGPLIRRDPRRLRAWATQGESAFAVTPNQVSWDKPVMEVTLGGRVTSRLPVPQARRQGWEYLVGDVVKAITYALALREFHVVAVAGNELVLEVPLVAKQRETERRIDALCKHASLELMRCSAPPCSFSWQSRWPTPQEA